MRNIFNSLLTILLIVPYLSGSNAKGRIEVTSLPGDAAVHHIIDQPGFYRLSQDLDISRATGISILSSGVILDLGEFSVRRTEGSGGHGILIALSASHSSVQNGRISGFAYGIRAFSSHGLYSGITVYGCSIAAITAGDDWTVEDCVAWGNAGSDIVLGNRSTLVTRPLPSSPPPAREYGNRPRQIRL
jgi:hypothetical protein